MWMIPYRKFEVDTALTASQAMSRLYYAIQSHEDTRYVGWNCAFEGVVGDNRYEFRRVIKYANPFLPRVTCYVESTPTGARVIGSMRLATVQAVSIGVWLAVIGLVNVATFPNAFALSLFAFVVIFVLVAFNPECSRTVRDIAREVDGSRVHIH